MDLHRHGSGSAPAGQTRQASGVIEVAMAEHDRVHVGHVAAQTVGVGHHGAGGEASVEQDGGRGATRAHADQCREAMLSHQTDLGGSGLELRRLRFRLRRELG
jgi:hypothetical protein